MMRWFCRHQHEIAGVGSTLVCMGCGHVRPHPWAGEPQRHHRVLDAKPMPLTGIEREATRDAEETEQVTALIQQMERRERNATIVARVKGCYKR